MINKQLKHHSVHRLYDARLKASTRPFLARGAHVQRCPFCRIDEQFCICSLRPETKSNAGFLLLYYDDEVLKPSNTGRLIADIIDDTFAFIWQRTESNPDLVSILKDEQWYPIIVFPAEYASEEREVFSEPYDIPEGLRPLFVLFDGTWRQAKKMFRKSPYLDQYPIASIMPEAQSRFLVRKATRDIHLATAEVAACLLDGVGEKFNSELLATWFDLFSFRYQCGVKRQNQGDSGAEVRLVNLLQKT